MSAPTIPLGDADLFAMLARTEDATVERKSQSDRRGWLRTAVAFANSTPVGYPSVLFIGVNDDGSIEDNLQPEAVSKSFSDYVAANTWPPIYSVSRILSQSGRSFLAVIIPGSPDRPHFAGRSYVRDGMQTKEASESQFDRLIAERSSMVREILRWKGKQIAHDAVRYRGTLNVMHSERTGKLLDCNQFFVTIEFGPGPPFQVLAISLAAVELSAHYSGDGIMTKLRLTTSD